MRKSLAKSIYLGAAALAFAGIAGATSASAKSYAKVTSIGSFKGNVVATGSNAVTTKAATLQGAKTVKSASALKTAQDADKTGNYNFRAYSVATTNRGSVYYKVVSFDKTVRGWVYGGKVKGTVAGGIKDFATTTDATAPTGDQTAKDGAQLWNAPAWTTYKVGRASEKLANGAKFTVSKAVTNSKSGDVYYQIAGTKTAADGKWIAAKDVNKTNTNATENNSVTVTYVDDNNNVVGTNATFVTTSTLTRKGDKVANNTDANNKGIVAFAHDNLPAGYAWGYSDGSNAAATTDPQDATSALFGGSLRVHVHAASTSKVSFIVDTVNNNNIQLNTPLAAGANVSSEVNLPKLTTAQLVALQGKSTATVDAANISSTLLTANAPLNKLVGTKTYTSRDNKNYHYEFTFTSSDKFATDNRLTTYGNNVVAAYTANLVEGAAPTSNANTDYVAK
ncbi:hypothetical protein [Secundilactobacillus kimchicus]|uniref:hypothetical protein n=1 Tax=Secundilactobacillus kimchicus TaxID=528209 RepID=UPI0024A9246A|nr:hypothetical protein [Secundilactobacillus kimchicus]